MSAAIRAPTDVRVGRLVGIAGRVRGNPHAGRWLLFLIAGAAGVAYAWGINSQGLETFYAAGVRSMAGNWHDFFYGAFDPQGTITLDKLPGALWVQALFVRVFGFSTWAMVLPQIVESVLTVLVLYRAVRRVAGTGAALIAAAILAASPVTVGSTRGNLSEPLYLLFLVLAADATLRAIGSPALSGPSGPPGSPGSRRSWYVAMVWVGLAFQAKMAEAWLVLPVLGLALVVGVPAGRWRVALRVCLGGLVAVAVSLVWVLGFALTPVADRPVADGSAHNSIFEQVFVYNGIERLGDPDGFGKQPLAPPSISAEVYTNLALSPATRAAYYPPANLSRPAWDRLFVGGLASDCAWFLPLAVIGAGAVFVTLRKRGRGDSLRAATLLWSGWLLVYGAMFSFVHDVQNYYLATLVPAIAALSGMGLAVLWRAGADARGESAGGANEANGTNGAKGTKRNRALMAAVAAVGVEAVWAVILFASKESGLRWVVIAIVALAVVGTFAVGLRSLNRGRAGRGSRAAAGISALALTVALVAPCATAGWLVVHGGGPFDTPFAATGTLAQPPASVTHARAGYQGYVGSILPATSPAVWAELAQGASHFGAQAADRGGEILVYQSPAAANFIMGGVTDVVPVGGYTGSVPTPSAYDVSQMILSGKVTLAYLPGDDSLLANDPRVVVIESLCTRDPDFPELGGARPVLYDCN